MNPLARLGNLQAGSGSAIPRRDDPRPIAIDRTQVRAIMMTVLRRVKSPSVTKAASTKIKASSPTPKLGAHRVSGNVGSSPDSLAGFRDANLRR
jgi:hypothetical protein